MKIIGYLIYSIYLLSSEHIVNHFILVHCKLAIFLYRLDRLFWMFTV